MGPRGPPGDALPGEKVQIQHKYNIAVACVNCCMALLYAASDYQCCKSAEEKSAFTLSHRETEAFLETGDGKETRETMENLDLWDQW